MVRKNKNFNEKRRKKVVLLTIAAIILAAALTLYIFRDSIILRSSIQEPDTSIQTDPINMNPPTDEEKRSGDDIKPEILENEQNRNSSNKQPVKPNITYAGVYSGNVEVGGYVSGIYEEGGTCTLTLRKNEKTMTTQVQAERGATSTDCPTLSIASSGLEKGTWYATMSYSSSSTEGSSEQKPIEVR